MIGYNISPDTKVTPDSPYYDLPHCEYFDLEYRTKDEKTAKKVRFVRPGPDGKYMGILPRTCQQLLKARKETRAKMKILDPNNENDQKVLSQLNSEQMAYKVSCNSIYGQTGSSFSQISDKEIAATVTAQGRRLIALSKQIAEELFDATVMYGDTDSIFIRFKLDHIVRKAEKEGCSHEEIRTRKRAETKRLSDLVAKMITDTINLPPIAIEYEKIFYPWISIGPKMYIGWKYEFDMNKYKFAEMGVSYKKRDYAPIVADVCKTLVNMIFETIVEESKNGDSEYVREITLDKVHKYIRDRIAGILEGNEPLDKFIITKSLRANYASPERIAHKVLADRMTRRDPGNAPRPNERLEFCFVEVPEYYNVRILKSGAVRIGAMQKIMTGDRIEHIDYIKEKNLIIDYAHYITNQLKNTLDNIVKGLGLDLTDTYNELLNESFLMRQTDDTIELMLEDFEVGSFDELKRKQKLKELKKKVYFYDYCDEHKIDY